MDQLFSDYGALLGVAAFVTFVINVLKRFDLIPDGKAAGYSAILNGVGFLVYIVLGVVQPEFVDWAAVDGIAMNLVAAGEIVLALIAQLGLSKLFHAGTRGVPILGFSYSQ